MQRLLSLTRILLRLILMEFEPPSVDPFRTAFRIAYCHTTYRLLTAANGRGLEKCMLVDSLVQAESRN